MEFVLFAAFGVGTVTLLALLIICYLILQEVKKNSKELKELKYSINRLNTSLLHYGSKLSLMIKHLSVIGSKLAPGSYKKKRSEQSN
jgi:hypothetical protein